jgi:hypothetical protein
MKQESIKGSAFRIVGGQLAESSPLSQHTTGAAVSAVAICNWNLPKNLEAFGDLTRIFVRLLD